MNRRPLILLLILLAAALAATLFYCLRHGEDQAAPAPAGPSAAMMEAMHRMHEGVSRTPVTGDLDRDFVALMVPHHQSAVEMARVYLEHGRDPELRRLSQNIVASQEAEIRQMRGRHPVPAAGSAPAAGH
ncbi:MAG TPA: DUF305 domain-containing protein [Allosphingosinicella sp.]|jgi:uncharacterized protein (DUF305 family)